MNLKKIKDSLPNQWKEVAVGVTMIPCGVVNENHTKFKPYLGHWVDGYDIYDKYGEYPNEEDADSQIKKDYADKWGVSVDEVFYGVNDTYEGGYLYTPGTELGDEIDIDPDLIIDEEGDLYLSDDYDRYVDDDERFFWYPVGLDQ